MPTTTVATKKDTYTKQDNPDSNFGSEDEVWVQRGDLSGNAWYTFVGIDYDLSDEPGFVRVTEILLRLDLANTVGDRILQAYTLAGDWTEDGLTWSNQPTLDTLLDETVSDFTDYHYWDVTGAIGDLQAASGSVQVGIRDSEDPQGTNVYNNAWWAREADIDPPTLEITWEAQDTSELASEIHVGPKHAHLASTVKPGTQPLAGEARAAGRIVHGFVDPLRDMALVSAKAGSRITRTQDGATRELTRVVQLVRSRVGADFPRSQSPDRDHLRAGDAVLFALGGDAFEPGATVEWQDGSWTVAGVLAVERIDGVAVYREVGLRRDGVLHHGRAGGTVQVDREVELRWCFVTVREAAHADLDSAVDVNTTL